MHFDAVLISDLHLGAKNCEAKQLKKLFRLLRHMIEAKKNTFGAAILAGDLVDSQQAELLTLKKSEQKIVDEIVQTPGNRSIQISQWESLFYIFLNHLPDIFGREKELELKKSHLKVVRQIEKLSKIIDVRVLVGNHDPDKKYTQQMFGIKPEDHCIFRSGDKRIFACHGHLHDTFIAKHPIITMFADKFYRWVQIIDPSHKLARRLKHGSKGFLEVTNGIDEKVAREAESKGCQIAFHGHNHKAGTKKIGEVTVYDSGCCTENPITITTIRKGEVIMYAFERNEKGRSSLVPMNDTQGKGPGVLSLG